jgi:TRAP-type C4-dicarboxylate transport system substrate-binding protein
MKHRRWTAHAAMLFGLVLLLAACPDDNDVTDPGTDDDGQSFSLTLGAGHPAGGAITYTTFAEDFLVPEIEQRVADETPHTIEIQEAYGGTIAELADILAATRDGLLDIGLVPYPFNPSELFQHNVAYYVPFGPPDPEAMISALRRTAEEFPEHFLDMLEDEWNQRLLGFAGVGNYGLVTTFEWETVDELQGRRIAGAGPNLPWIEAAGAVPVAGNLTEWYTQLETGVIDAAIMFPDSAYGFRLHEPAPNYKITNFGAIGVGGIHINLDTWNGLPPEVQDIIAEVSREYEDRFGERTQADDDRALEAMEEDGVTISELDPAEAERWAEMIPNIPNLRAQEACQMGLPGDEILRAYLQFVEEEFGELPRDWEIEDC